MLDLPNKGTILILPSVSSANVPQLAVDLFVNSLNIPFCSILDHQGLLYPFAGPRESTEPVTGISSSLDVYHNEQFTCLIQRSPTLPSSRLAFVTKIIIPLIQQNNFSRILLLASTDALRRLNPGGPKAIAISFLDQGNSTPTILDLSRKISRLSVQDTTTSAVQYEEYSLPGRLPGSGITLSFLREAVKLNLPVASIILYAYDGDNFDDAVLMADMAVETLGIESPASWTPPPSWDGVYGKKPQVGLEHGLYG
ncbi:PAC2 family-domain-containing protein [Lipomyces arxii]|uniref:PAC2 family-domain-containing protein n=1 Tax=Lipomyces arxii TaxID=56418 RepID=UPI0034CFBDBA